MEKAIKMPEDIKKVNEVVWEVPVTYKKGMLVPARIYASYQLLHGMDQGVFDQVSNVACLPGIQKYAYCMPDGHIAFSISYCKASGAMGFRLAELQHLMPKQE